MDIDDSIVWRAYESARDEGKKWRVIVFRDRGVIVVNDILKTPDYVGGTEIANKVAFERHDFSDEESANRFIEWRAIKAALESYCSAQQGKEG